MFLFHFQHSESSIVKANNIWEHFLCDELVWDGSESDGSRGVAQQHSDAGLLGLALQRHPLALGLGVLEQTLVLLDATQEILTALAVLDVLDADVDALS